MEKSIPCRKEKKIIFDKIEEAEKEKEDAEKYWKEQEEIEKKKKMKIKMIKRKKRKIKDDKNKKVYPKPEEIEIPKYDEYTNEMFVILYNFLLSKEEFMGLENEKK